ncbi:hypothetical protein ACSBR2_038008 [Camellia fascicularis]
MSFPINLTILFPLLFTLFIPYNHAATFDIQNKCPYTVWAAASPGGGQRLDPDQSWTLNVKPGTTQALIWGRTNCNFDASGQGQCETGDCNGLLECKGYGKPPNTVAEFSLDQPNNVDYFDISNVYGFNIPIDLSPTTAACHGKRCAANLIAQCPNKLQAPGGCNNPCTVFKTDEYCCTNGAESCGPTVYSEFFKDRCPDAYSYPKDDATSLFTCPSGANYVITFCP